MENKCRNRNIKYVKELFATNKAKKPKGKRLLISNGGYKTKNSDLHFGYRCYYDSKAGVLYAQVLSEASEMRSLKPLREYGVEANDTNVNDMLYQVETAILYSEYCDRVLLNKKLVSLYPKEDKEEDQDED
jgi:hypothetical protein